MLAFLLLFVLESRVRQSGTGCTALLRFGTGTADEVSHVATDAASPIKNARRAGRLSLSADNRVPRYPTGRRIPRRRALEIHTIGDSAVDVQIDPCGERRSLARQA